jgi:hypothetical protein
MFPSKPEGLSEDGECIVEDENGEFESFFINAALDAAGEAFACLEPIEEDDFYDPLK